MSLDELGDRMKFYEKRTESVALPHTPLLVRIDGKAFHTWTKPLPRPYCDFLSKLMIDTTKYLVEEFVATIGYTQSDEISLLFHQKEVISQLPFGGRIQKLASVLASATAAWFNKHVEKYFTFLQHSDELALFDCRVWYVPNKEEAINYFIWRERDAIKNSVQMAAQEYYSHSELQGKNGSEQQEMLFQKQVNWNDYPSFFKRGTYVKKKLCKVISTDKPACYRHKTIVLDTDGLSKETDKMNFVFGEAKPEPIEDVSVLTEIIANGWPCGYTKYN